MLRIGIDIGGTFTDFVVYDPENFHLTTFKLLSDSSNPALTVLQGIQQIVSDQPAQIIHGSTVATNALLERKGARTALITTAGFKDVLQIARQNRPSLYDWTVKPSPPLVPSELRFEVDERVDHLGKVQQVINSIQIDNILRVLGENHVESVAVCFLFSFLYPNHEQLVAEKLRNFGFIASISSEILPEFREYERTSTTVVNAYVSPILNNYLSLLESALPNSNLQIMQSNGGMISVPEARKNGAKCILSGPAGGIVGAQNVVTAILEHDNLGMSTPSLKLITFDMGGTSTDVSLINGQPSLTSEASIGGYPIHLPLLDIHTIGSGGGSIAYVDAGGSLHVGPQSAGADPGPACYGKGILPTVTDANLVLGRLLPDFFLGGKMPLIPDRAVNALAQLGNELGMSARQAARGVIEVVNAQMERALRIISVERGFDPRDFYLFSFGGAGGLHAMQLAHQMGITKVIVSKYASTLSAFGMISTNIIKDYVKTVMLPGTVDESTITELFTPLLKQGKYEVNTEGIPLDKIDLQMRLDVRFLGQSYELSVPYSDHFVADFHVAHQLSYGYTYDDKPLEIVNLRLRAIGKIDPIRQPQVSSNNKANPPDPIKYQPVELSSGIQTLPVFNYETLPPGGKLTGPAIIVSPDTTILLDTDDIVRVDSYQNLIIDISRENE